MLSQINNLIFANFYILIFLLLFLQKNRSVCLALTCELVLDVLPTLVTFTFTVVSGHPHSNYVGDLLNFCVSLEAALCGCFYWRMLHLRKSVVGTAKKAQVDGTIVVVDSNNSNAMKEGHVVRIIRTGGTARLDRVINNLKKCEIAS